VCTIHNLVSPGVNGHILLLLLSERPEIRRQNGRPTSRGGVVGDRFICVVVIVVRVFSNDETYDETFRRTGAAIVGPPSCAHARAEMLQVIIGIIY